MMTFKVLKKEFSALLVQDDWQARLEPLLEFPPRKVLGPLFSLLLAPEPLLRWRAVSAFGVVTARLAEQNMESARVIMRRLMWNLNEESGAIGWGAPESMGESMARNTTLADEFHRILISYAQEPISGDGNFLDHAPLRWGAYWGMARLAENRPDLMQKSEAVFVECLGEDDSLSRAVGLWGLISVGNASSLPLVLAQIDDQSQITLYRGDTLRAFHVGELAQEAASGIKSRQSQKAGQAS